MVEEDIGDEMMDEETKAFLRRANAVDKSIRPCLFVEYYKMGVLDDHTRQFILTSFAVIPGETRYDCMMCGYCCSNENVKLPKEFAEEGKPCKNLSKQKCMIEEDKPNLCKQFPFRWIAFKKVKDGKIISEEKMLMISIHCLGQMMGRVIDEERYRKILEAISNKEIEQTRCL